MQTPGLERLIVRLGFEIFVPNLKSAMRELDALPMYKERLFVNLPWESGMLTLSNKLSLTIDELKQLNITQEQRLSTEAKQLAATEQRLSKMELRKDPAEQLRQLKCYRDTDDRLVEECVSSSVAAKINDGDVVHAMRYEFQGTGGDLDGMVVGRWDGGTARRLLSSSRQSTTWTVVRPRPRPSCSLRGYIGQSSWS